MDLKEYIKSLVRETLEYEPSSIKHPKINMDFNNIKVGQKVVLGKEENIGDLGMKGTGKIISITPDSIIVKDSYGYTKEFNKKGELKTDPEYKILTLVVKEESTTTGVPGYMTPRAFSPKDQGKNAATKAAEKQGFKVTKGETEMPADSKVRDYKSLWNKKKKRVKIYNERSNYDQASKQGAASGYTSSSGYTGPSLATKGGGYYASAIKETMENIVKEELLNEVTYHKFKNEVKFRTKNEQLHKAIREVKRKLAEIDRIVEYTSRMKQELSEGEEGLKYWKKTESNIAAISEMVNHLNNKIKNLNQ